MIFIAHYYALLFYHKMIEKDNVYEKILLYHFVINHSCNKVLLESYNCL